MTVWKPMKDAPYNGTRVLLKVRVVFDSRARRCHRWEGTKVLEAWWARSSDKFRWNEWTGSVHVHSTDHFDPIEWTEVPS